MALRKRQRKPAAPSRFTPWQALAAALGLAVAGVLCYANSLRVPFIFDDPIHIANNPSLPQIWPPSDALRPVVGLTLALNYRWSALAPYSYHVVNLAIHILAGWALFGLARRTLLTETLAPRFGRAATPLALAVALLWMVHPLPTQAVTYVIQRSESLMALCYLLTLYCAARAHDSPHRGWWWCGAGAAFALGAGTKQVMVTAPVMVVLYYWVFFPGVFAGLARKGWLYVVAALLWIGLCGALIRLSSHVTAGFGMVGVTPWAYAWTECGVLLRYLRLACWPAGLCVDYGYAPAPGVGQAWGPWSQPEAWGAAGAVGLLAAGTAWGLARRRPLAFLGAWFLVILAPTSSFMPIQDVAVEHRMYLPLAGVVALVVLAAYVWGGRGLDAVGGAGTQRSFPARAGAWSLLLAAAMGLGSLTVARNRDYQHEEDLWKRAADECPWNARALTNYAAALTRAERPAEAIPFFERALKLRPDNADAHSGLGGAYGKLGQSDRALAELNEAIRLKPGHAEARRNLAVAYIQKGQLDQAIASCEDALRINPFYPEAHVILGNCLFSQGQYEPALTHYQEAVRLRPDYAEAYSNMGSVCVNLNQPEQAIQYYETALRHKPDFAEAHSSLAAVLAQTGRLQQALDHCQQAVEKKPDFALGHNNMASVLVQLGRAQEGAQQAELALRLNRDYPEAHYNLANALAKLGRTQEAASHYREALRLRPRYAEAQAGLEQLGRGSTPP